MKRALAVPLSLVAVLTVGCAGDRAPAREAAPPSQPEPQVSATDAGLTVHYLGNEGFLVEGGGRRVLVDALFGDGIPGYAAVEPGLREQLENGTGRWGDVDVALATHHHGDHFDAAAVARFLEANPEALFVSTPQARQRMADGDPALLDRFHAVLPAEGESVRLELAGVAIDVLNLHHGRRAPPVENLGFIVTAGATRWLHFGDTEAKIEDFEPYLEALSGTDLALLPFWFLSSQWRAEMVRDRIGPRWIVAGHTPLPSAPAGHFGRWGSYEGLVDAMRAAFPAARLPGRSGESWRFGDSPD